MSTDGWDEVEALKLAAKEFRDARWALIGLEDIPRLDPQWNAAVLRWREADIRLASELGETSPFSIFSDVDA
jgi:hypothetical protein